MGASGSPCRLLSGVPEAGTSRPCSMSGSERGLPLSGSSWVSLVSSISAAFAHIHYPAIWPPLLTSFDLRGDSILVHSSHEDLAFNHAQQLSAQSET